MQRLNEMIIVIAVNGSPCVLARRAIIKALSDRGDDCGPLAGVVVAAQQ